MDYEELNNLIGRLKESVEDCDPKKGYWKELWNLAKEIGAGFKETRYPTKDEKDQAWKEFELLREQARRRSEESRARFEKQQEEWQQREQLSSRLRAKVQCEAIQSHPSTGIVRAIGDIILLPLLMIETMLRQILGLEELDHLREELLACNAQLREAWDLFNQHKSDMLPGDKAQTYKTLADAKERLDVAWQQWKAQNNKFYEARREKSHENHQRFVEKVEANITKLEDRLERARAALENHEAHLEKLQDDLENAWNDGFRERCSGWIDECENKVTDIKADIDRVETWIDEERSKLN